LTQRIPVTDPAPAIKLGLGGPGHADSFILAGQPKQKWFLLRLADADRLGVAANQPLRQTIAQPATGAGEDFHILRQQADFFMQLPIQCLLGAFIALDTALRKLPGLLTDTPGP